MKDKTRFRTHAYEKQNKISQSAYDHFNGSSKKEENLRKINLHLKLKVCPDSIILVDSDSASSILYPIRSSRQSVAIKQPTLGKPTRETQPYIHLYKHKTNLSFVKYASTCSTADNCRGQFELRENAVNIHLLLDI